GPTGRVLPRLGVFCAAQLPVNLSRILILCSASFGILFFAKQLEHNDFALDVLALALVMYCLGGAAVLHCLAAVRLSGFTERLILDYDLGPVDAIRAKWRITRGHADKLVKVKLRLWLIQFVGCIIGVGIGLFLLQPYVALVWTSAYLDIAGSEPIREDIEIA